MRIWHEDLIPKLCRQHLIACWREGLGCWEILENNKQGYRNHPAVKEFEGRLSLLADRLVKVRREMLHRGYKPKDLSPFVLTLAMIVTDTSNPNEWQTLEEQIEVLQVKNCDCEV